MARQQTLSTYDLITIQDCTYTTLNPRNIDENEIREITAIFLIILGPFI